MKKIKRRSFWNFIIQFFVVVLGVFFTLWVSNIAEQSKQKKKTRDALDLIVEELEDYRSVFEERKQAIELEVKMYQDLMLMANNPNQMPSIDTLTLYKNTFLEISLSWSTILSLDIAEKTGALSTINNLSLLESIYTSFLTIDYFYQLNRDHNQYKQEQIYKSAAIRQLNLTTKDPSIKETEEEIKSFWMNIIEHQNTLAIITSGFINSKLQLNLLQITFQQLDESINGIREYLH